MLSWSPLASSGKWERWNRRNIWNLLIMFSMARIGLRSPFLSNPTSLSGTIGFSPPGNTSSAVVIIFSWPGGPKIKPFAPIILNRLASSGVVIGREGILLPSIYKVGMDQKRSIPALWVLSLTLIVKERSL